MLRLRRREKNASDNGPVSLNKLDVVGDTRIDGGAVFPSGLVARGNLRLGAGARVQGDIEVAGTLVLDDGARIEGDAKVAGEARFGVGACVTGALSCQRLLLAARERAPGDDETPASVSGSRQGTNGRGG